MQNCVTVFYESFPPKQKAMSPPRLFVRPVLAPAAVVQLTAVQSDYVHRVLRLRAGAFVSLFNERDGQWRATLTASAASKGPMVAVVGDVQERRPDLASATTRRPDLWLVFAPVKRRLEDVVDSGTQLGVTRFMPALMQRSVVTKTNTERLCAIATEAAEQCERLDVPRVDPMVPLALALAGLDKTASVIVCDEQGSRESGATPSLMNHLRATATRAPTVVLVVGPEGGLAPADRVQLCHGQHVHLGPRILRAETACVSALSLVQAAWGDLSC